MFSSSLRKPIIPSSCVQQLLKNSTRRNFSQDIKALARPYKDSKKQHHVPITEQELRPLRHEKNMRTKKIHDPAVVEDINTLWKNISEEGEAFVEKALKNETERGVLNEVVQGAKFYGLDDIYTAALKLANDIEAKEATSRRGKLLFVTLSKSAEHQPDHVQQAVRVLKLTKTNETQVHRDTPVIRGLVYTCRHLLNVKLVGTEELFPQGTYHIDVARMTKRERIADKVQNRYQEKVSAIEKQVKAIEQKYRESQEKRAAEQSLTSATFAQAVAQVSN